MHCRTKARQLQRTKQNHTKGIQNRPQSLTEEHKNNISCGLKKAFKEGRKHYVKPNYEKLRDNCVRNQSKMIEGRRNSEKWRDSVTCAEYRQKRSNTQKGRKILWADKISAHKKGADTKNSKNVFVDLKKFNSISALADFYGIESKHKLYRFFKNNRSDFITLAELRDLFPHISN